MLTLEGGEATPVATKHNYEFGWVANDTHTACAALENVINVSTLAVNGQGKPYAGIAKPGQFPSEVTLANGARSDQIWSRLSR